MKKARPNFGVGSPDFIQAAATAAWADDAHVAERRRGFRAKRDVHTSVGAGLRFFLRSVAVPLVGVDAGYGLPDGPVRIVLVIGA